MTKQPGRSPMPPPTTSIPPKRYVPETVFPECPDCTAPLRYQDDLCPRCGNLIPWSRQD